MNKRSAHGVDSDDPPRAAFLDNTDKLLKLQRYETSLNRDLYTALHELQRLQAARLYNRPVAVARHWISAFLVKRAENGVGPSLPSLFFPGGRSVLCKGRKGPKGKKP